MRRMRPLASLVHDAIQSPEILAAARASRIMKQWEQVVGPGLAQRSHPDRFQRGTLWVAVQGSAWAQELRMMKDVILSRLNSLADEPDLFRDVRFGVRPLPENKLTEEPKRENDNAVEELSIKEIAQRRLKNWKGPL